MDDMMCSQGCIQYAQSSCKIPKPCLLSDGLAYMGEHRVAGQEKAASFTTFTDPQAAGSRKRSSYPIQQPVYSAAFPKRGTTEEAVEVRRAEITWGNEERRSSGYRRLGPISTSFKRAQHDSDLPKGQAGTVRHWPCWSFNKGRRNGKNLFKDCTVWKIRECDMEE